jgi:hypothetical protein
MDESVVGAYVHKSFLVHQAWPSEGSQVSTNIGEHIETEQQYRYYTAV